jgi:CDP-diacylglycerol--glycerol-3-phosphate 3-phosphatidyltransferase
MKHLPNALTILRILITPVFLALLLMGTLLTQLAALILFIVAAITDWLDGRLARHYQLDSRVGRFLDPLADKILVLGAFIALPFLPQMGALIPWWAIGLLAARDLAVTLLRSWAESRGRSIPTRNEAKIKTAVQLTFLITLFTALVVSKLDRFGGWVGELGSAVSLVLYGPTTFVLLMVTVALTLYTGALYFMPARTTPAS